MSLSLLSRVFVCVVVARGDASRREQVDKVRAAQADVGVIFFGVREVGFYNYAVPERLLLSVLD